MSFKEVNSLRRSGKLEEAFQMATSDLQKEPENIWCKRAMGWVYYEFVKKAVENADQEGFLIQLEEIASLELPPDETMLFDSLLWQIGKLLFANKVPPSFLNTLFSLIKNFSFSYPGDQYSFVLKAFKKHATEWDGFLDFVRWWGLENFQKNDFENFILDNGKKMPSAVESVYIAVSKKLLAQADNTDSVNEFLPQLAEVCHAYPKMQYTHYYHAKLLLASGDRHRFLKAFLPFAQKKQRDFWVWDLLSEVYDKNSKEYYACLCKSLSCGAPDKFIINVREKIADIFIGKQMFAEAKYEYQKIIKTREQEGWALRDRHLSWKLLNWWNKTGANNNNFLVYQSNMALANSLLYGDTNEEIVVLDYVNNEKQVFNFIVSKQKYGFSSYKAFHIKPKTGEFYAVRFSEKADDKSNFYRILSIRKTEKIPSAEIYKTQEGRLTKRESNSFGFVGDVFVRPQIIQKYKLKNGDLIKGTALQSYNSKRKAWGWNLIAIEK